MIPTKKHSGILLGTVIFSLLVTQCEMFIKDQPAYNSITFGEITPHLDIQTIDSLIEYKFPGSYPFGNGVLEFPIDLDRDENPDILLSNHSNHSKWGLSSRTYLYIFDSKFEIAEKVRTDTVFSCGFADYSHPEYPIYDTVFFSHQTKYTCTYAVGIKEIQTNSYPETKFVDEMLVPDSYWNEDSVIFLTDYSDYQVFSMLTEYEIRYHFGMIFGLQSLSRAQYVPIRKKTDDGYLYGWIKIGIGEESAVYLYETALEKEIVLDKYFLQDV